MSAPSSPPSTRRSARRGSSPSGPAANGRASYLDPGMRISDAERTEVADRLSRHYSDGRLDQEEFSKRLDQAMNATTQADLGGLFADLPETELHAGQTAAGPSGRSRRPSPEPRPGMRRHGGRPHRVLTFILVIVVAIAVANALAHWFVPLFVIGAIVLAWLWFSQRRRH
jgi:Flp pilus assembly protein TadB